MRPTAKSSGCKTHLARIAFCVGDEFRNRRDRNCRVHQHNVWGAHDAGNWRDVADEIEIEFLIKRGIDRDVYSRLRITRPEPDRADARAQYACAENNQSHQYISHQDGGTDVLLRSHADAGVGDGELDEVGTGSLDNVRTRVR